jgi:hypothetical protein
MRKLCRVQQTEAWVYSEQGSGDEKRIIIKVKRKAFVWKSKLWSICITILYKKLNYIKTQCGEKT